MRIAPIVFLLAAVTFSGIAQAGAGAPCLVAHDSPRSAAAEVWSETEPPISLTHVFEGEINRRGKAVGFHHRPGGRDPSHACVTRILDGPNAAGVYTAEVAVWDGDAGRWRAKSALSSMFPDRLTRNQVIAAVLHAFRNAVVRKGAAFTGPSGHRFAVRGYVLRDGRIITAFPLYRPDDGG